MTTEAILKALNHLWSVLTPLNLPMAVMGGMAVAAWNRVRATYDVDLLIAVDDARLDEVLFVLSEAGIRGRRENPRISLKGAEFLQFAFEPPETFIDVRIDLMLANSEFQRHALSRRTPLHDAEFGIEMDVLTCEDIILFKLIAGRIIDLADAAALLRARRDRLDLPYLANWAAKLHLANELARVWEEAFPGESPPAGEAAAN